MMCIYASFCHAVLGAKKSDRTVKALSQPRQPEYREKHMVPSWGTKRDAKKHRELLEHEEILKKPRGEAWLKVSKRKSVIIKFQ